MMTISMRTITMLTLTILMMTISLTERLQRARVGRVIYLIDKVFHLKFITSKQQDRPLPPPLPSPPFSSSSPLPPSVSLPVPPFPSSFLTFASG